MIGDFPCTALVIGCRKMLADLQGNWTAIDRVKYVKWKERVGKNGFVKVLDALKGPELHDLPPPVQGPFVQGLGDDDIGRSIAG